jgi:alkanesulfonate monooxygenase
MEKLAFLSSDVEQARQGDHVGKEERYDRSDEYIRILRRAWHETRPWDHDGRFYQFENFVAGFRPVNGTIPVSVGGSSDAAYRVGGALGDIFGLWGEPLRETREQMDRVAAQARLAGRPAGPRTWVTFRPIVAKTDELAWEKVPAPSDTSDAPLQRVTGVLSANAGSGVKQANPAGACAAY